MRIGLIAMSGVRVVNPKLVELGVTLPQFVNRGEVIAQLPSLALLVLAAVTPDDTEVEYIEVADVKAQEPLDTSFDLVALTSYTAMAYEMYELADRYRAAGVPVVIGGLHASFAAEEAKEHADAVCVGEGETLWPRDRRGLHARAAGAALKPFYRESAPGTYDLANSPMPRFELLLGRRYNRITVQTVRGCPLDCEFCGASKLYGPKYRRKPLEKRGRRNQADQGALGRQCVLRAGRRQLVRESDLGARIPDRHSGPRSALVHRDRHLHRRRRRAACACWRSSGCRQILIGLESINPSSLDGIDRANWKLKRLTQYEDAINKIQSYGVTVNGCFIVGNDGDDPGVFEGLRDFIERSELLEAQVTILTPFPGTPLLRRLRAEGRLLYDRFWDKCTLFDLVFQPKQMTPDELIDGHAWLMSQIYNQEQYTRRKRHYVNIMKQSAQPWMDPTGESLHLPLISSM